MPDALYVKIREREIHGSEEMIPGVFVDYDENSIVVGIEVLWFSRRGIDPARITTEGPEAMVCSRWNKVHNSRYGAIKTSGISRS